MVDLTEQERAAIAATVKPVAEIMKEIDWNTRLIDLTEAHVLTLIEVVVGGFQTAMHATARITEAEIPFLMMDYNHQPKMADHVNAAIDAALQAANAASPSRDYLGGSRLGHACERALQFEFTAAPKDEGAEFDGRLLRIFWIGHALEDLAIAWLRAAGFDLYTCKGGRPDGEQFGFSVGSGRIRGHVDGILANGPPVPGMGFPALWECKTMNAKSWRETASKGVAASKPAYAAQIAIYQAYMDAAVPGVADHPALFTAINKDTAELHHELVPFDAALAQRMSDRAVRILQATDAGDLLPRIAQQADHFECRMCSWAQRCWTLAV